MIMGQVLVFLSTTWWKYRTYLIKYLDKKIDDLENERDYHFLFRFRGVNISEGKFLWL